MLPNYSTVWMVSSIPPLAVQTELYGGAMMKRDYNQIGHMRIEKTKIYYDAPEPPADKEHDKEHPSGEFYCEAGIQDCRTCFINGQCERQKEQR